MSLCMIMKILVSNGWLTIVDDVVILFLLHRFTCVKRCHLSMRCTLLSLWIVHRRDQYVPKLSFVSLCLLLE